MTLLKDPYKLDSADLARIFKIPKSKALIAPDFFMGETTLGPKDVANLFQKIIAETQLGPYELDDYNKRQIGGNNQHYYLEYFDHINRFRISLSVGSNITFLTTYVTYSREAL